MEEEEKRGERKFNEGEKYSYRLRNQHHEEPQQGRERRPVEYRPTWLPPEPSQFSISGPKILLGEFKLVE
jgi:hypothetical protein